MQSAGNLWQRLGLCSISRLSPCSDPVSSWRTPSFLQGIVPSLWQSWSCPEHSRLHYKAALCERLQLSVPRAICSGLGSPLLLPTISPQPRTVVIWWLGAQLPLPIRWNDTKMLVLYCAQEGPSKASPSGILHCLPRLPASPSYSLTHCYRGGQTF